MLRRATRLCMRLQPFREHGDMHWKLLPHFSTKADEA
jgi:hypothetical protein